MGKPAATRRVTAGQGLAAGLVGVWTAGLTVAPAHAAAEPPLLLWYSPGNPPGVITDGPLRGQGYVDRMLTEVVFPALPAWKHRLEIASAVRIIRDLQTLPVACTPAIVWSEERSRTLAMSRPVYHFLPVGLVVRSADLPALAPLVERRQLSLGNYLAQPGVRVGISGQRSYSPTIDAALKVRPEATRSYNLSASNLSMMAMVAGTKGIDATLAYSFELQYQRRIGDPHVKGLAWLPIAGATSVIPGHTACSPTAQGRSVIAALDTLLKSRAVRDKLQSIYEDWLDDESRSQLGAWRQGGCSGGC
jgi:uncharacterized protein (TIGR02285 family)